MFMPVSLEPKFIAEMGELEFLISSVLRSENWYKSNAFLLAALSKMDKSLYKIVYEPGLQ